MREEGSPFDRMDHAQLIQGFSAHFFVSVVELTPFLAISVCWFWLSQTRKQRSGEMGLLV